MIKLTPLFLFLILCPFYLCSQNLDPALTDKVSTLQLTETLPSRSQLGGLVVDQLGYIYIANFADKVWRVSPEGEVKLLTDGLYGSSGNTIDKEGNLYQANFFGHSITKIDRFGKIETIVNKDLNGPVGMIFDAADNLYVCNCSGNTISKITPDGQVSLFAQHPQFNCPNGIAMDDKGLLYLANFGNDIIHRIHQDGRVEEFITIPGAEGNAHIVFSRDNFYVTKIKIRYPAEKIKWWSIRQHVEK